MRSCRVPSQPCHRPRFRARVGRSILPWCSVPWVSAWLCRSWPLPSGLGSWPGCPAQGRGWPGCAASSAWCCLGPRSGCFPCWPWKPAGTWPYWRAACSPPCWQPSRASGSFPWPGRAPGNCRHGGCAGHHRRARPVAARPGKADRNTGPEHAGRAVAPVRYHGAAQHGRTGEGGLRGCLGGLVPDLQGERTERAGVGRRFSTSSALQV